MDTTSSKHFRKGRLLIGTLGFVVGFVIYFTIGFFIGDNVPSWMLGGKYPTASAFVAGLFCGAIALAFAEKRKRIPTADEIRSEEARKRRNPIGIVENGRTDVNTTTRER